MRASAQSNILHLKRKLSEQLYLSPRLQLELRRAGELLADDAPIAKVRTPWKLSWQCPYLHIASVWSQDHHPTHSSARFKYFQRCHACCDV